MLGGYKINVDENARCILNNNVDSAHTSRSWIKFMHFGVDDNCNDNYYYNVVWPWIKFRGAKQVSSIIYTHNYPGQQSSNYAIVRCSNRTIALEILIGFFIEKNIAANNQQSST